MQPLHKHLEEDVLCRQSGLMQVFTESCFWPLSLTGACHMHPAGTRTCFTLHKQAIHGNSVHIMSIDGLGNQFRIQGDFFLNIHASSNVRLHQERCNFIYLNWWTQRKLFSFLKNPKGSCIPISNYLSKTVSLEICATLFFCT